MIELIVFETDPVKAAALHASGYSSFIVDLETLGKDLRQLGYDTEINCNTVDDIRHLYTAGIQKVWTRVNGFGDHSKTEIEEAIRHGTACIILPMVRTIDEVDACLDYIDGRAELCVMIETQESVALAKKLDRMPIASAYFGLNDFAICYNNRNIFFPVASGVVAQVRGALGSKRFGFGGLTHPESGFPIPSIQILHELERIDCSFTFMRRSFKRDLALYGAGEIIQKIIDAWRLSRLRTPQERIQDHSDLVERIKSIDRLNLI